MADIDTLQFLPIGPRYSRPAAPKAAARDKYADPTAQLAVRLGQYGRDLLDIIKDDYEIGVPQWKAAFEDVLDAWDSALKGREQTFVKAQKEREADAARDAFVLSLLTSGAMVFLGALVQYAVVPKFTATNYKFVSKYNWDTSDLEKFGTKFEGLVGKTEERFSKMQAAMFGGIVKDAGGKVVPLAFPKPTAIFSPDNLLTVQHLKATNEHLFADSIKVVVGTLKDAKQWMIDDTEFGELWAAYCNFNENNARAAIRARISDLRDQWAKDWQFFGQTPRPVPVPLLANQYERALWADYIVQIFPTSGVPIHHVIERGSYTDYTQNLKDLENYADYAGIKWVEAAIVNRLKELNVDVAETERGLVDQANRMIAGEPRPEMHIKGAVNTGHDIEEIYGWAQRFMTHAKAETAHKFFPPGEPRRFKPL